MHIDRPSGSLNDIMHEPRLLDSSSNLAFHGRIVSLNNNVFLDGRKFAL